MIEINQTAALAGGVTASDTPGFPVRLDEPGSHRLTSDLIVPDATTRGIEVLADLVTIDLNGFAIRGPTVCMGSPTVTPCTPMGGGYGIIAPTRAYDHTTVRNGTISGVGNTAVSTKVRWSRI